MWYDTFNAVFFLSSASILCGGLGVLLTYCFKSKCSEFSICGKNGFIYVKRDTDAENEEIKIEMDHIPRVNV
jgi:hypothetical protein